MHNEREFLIEQVLARRQEADAGWAPRRPDCPEVATLMECALGQATAETVRQVEEHCAGCADCRTRLAAYRAAVQDEEAAEPAVDGSLLERVAEPGAFVPQPAEERPRPPALDETPIGQGTTLAFTQMARDPKQWPTLLARLKPWVPFLLRRAGLPESLAGDLLGWVEQRLPDLGERRFRHALGEWVAEFAHARGLAEPKWLPSALTSADLGEGAVAIETGGDTPDEPAAVRRLKEAVRARAIVSADDILGVDLPGTEADPDFAEYRSRLFFQAQNRLEEGQYLFELV
jgi:hypothetical protein